MLQNDPSLVFGQWPHQQHQQPPPSQYSPAYQTPIVYGTIGQQYHTPSPTQYARIYGSTSQQQNQYSQAPGGGNQAAFQTQNSWDPVMSTNLSQSIADSAYSTNLAASGGSNDKSESKS